MRIVVGESVQPVALERCKRNLAPLGNRPLVDLQPELDILADRAPGQQQVLLKHEGHVAVRPLDRLAVDEHLADAWPVEAGGQIKERALAASARADQRYDLAILDRERDILDGGDRRRPARAAEPAGDIAKFEAGGRHPIRLPNWLCVSVIKISFTIKISSGSFGKGQALFCAIWWLTAP